MFSVASLEKYNQVSSKGIDRLCLTKMIQLDECAGIGEISGPFFLTQRDEMKFGCSKTSPSSITRATFFISRWFSPKTLSLAGGLAT